MTAEQKISTIEAQMRAVLRGDTNILNCPYCGAHNKRPSDLAIDQEPEPLCCADFALAIEAVILKLETDFHLDAAERIAEGAEKMAVMN